METTNTCVSCGVKQALDQFQKTAGRRDRLTLTCLGCRQNVLTRYYERQARIETILTEGNKDATGKELSLVEAKAHVLAEQRAKRDEVSRQLEMSMAVARKEKKAKKEIRQRQKAAYRNACSRAGGQYLGKLLIKANFEQFVIHIENLFQTGMNWSNYGMWHVDHIFPLSEAIKLGLQKYGEACQLPNLQPLWGSDNTSKGSYVEESQR